VPRWTGTNDVQVAALVAAAAPAICGYRISRRDFDLDQCAHRIRPIY
ncbi:MAG: hypothetical protein HIU82_04925, partial [Proteobacteria bacterium]|nr:hypothetical protein [Pseudomonadota bacterium]